MQHHAWIGYKMIKLEFIFPETRSYYEDDNHAIGPVVPTAMKIQQLRGVQSNHGGIQDRKTCIRYDSLAPHFRDTPAWLHLSYTYKEIASFRSVS